MQRHNAFLGNVSGNDPAFQVRVKFTKLFANFIKTGNPTPNLDPTIGFIWTRSTPQNQEYLDIQESFVMKKHPYQERMDMFMKFDRRFLP